MPSPEEVIVKIEQSLAWNRQFIDHAEENFVMPSEIAQTVKLIAQDELILSALKAYTGKPEPADEFFYGCARMILCEICGNKRCPHATDTNLACTNSNEPGQKGSAYENAPFANPSLAEEGQEGQSSHFAGDKIETESSSSPVRTSERTSLATVERLAEAFAQNRAHLLSIVYHHQGGSSIVGQGAREALGIGERVSLTSKQVEIARAFDAKRAKAGALTDSDYPEFGEPR